MTRIIDIATRQVVHGDLRKDAKDLMQSARVLWAAADELWREHEHLLSDAERHELHQVSYGFARAFVALGKASGQIPIESKATRRRRGVNRPPRRAPETRTPHSRSGI